jgi:hypothetical protein
MQPSAGASRRRTGGRKGGGAGNAVRGGGSLSLPLDSRSDRKPPFTGAFSLDENPGRPAAFGELGLHRLEAATLVDSMASHRVLEKNRFELIGLASLPPDSRRAARSSALPTNGRLRV